MNNLTLISCSYNTPIVIMTMLKSFFCYHDKSKVLICDNSTNDDTKLLLEKNYVPHFTNSGGLHSPSVDLLISKCTTDNALLVDSDIIFLKNHEDIYKSFIDLDITLLGDICGNRGGKQIHYRVHPWHCFINIKKIKHHNIKFHDSIRLGNKTQIPLYDVGCSFFEDIRKDKLKIGDIKLQDIYYQHYEGMSWRTQKYNKNKTSGDIDVDIEATHKDENLYKYGKLIESYYMDNIKKFENIKINVI